MSEILLLGGSGYLGRHLVDAWLEEGREVWAPSRNPVSPQLARRARPGLHIITLDTFRPANFLADHPSASIIVNAAGSYGRNGQDLDSVIAANLTFPLSVLGACAASAQPRTFINAATSLPPMLSGYALSKSQFSDWGRFLSASGSALTFIDARLQHFYGPAAPSSNFVTHLIQACLSGRASIALTDGRQQRDFIYIDDVVNAFTILARASCQHPFVSIDIGSGTTVSIRSLATMIRDLCKSSISLDFGALPYRAHEPMECRADLAVLGAFGWHPLVSLREGLQRTIDKDIGT